MPRTPSQGDPQASEASDGDALRVSARVLIPRDELQVRATRAGGPGGQHVNTSSSRIELQWNLLQSRALPEPLRALALERLAGRLSREGALRITASEHRSQSRNREAAEARLVALLREAIRRPTPRRPTAPTKGSVERRLDSKRQQKSRKAERRWTPDD